MDLGRVEEWRLGLKQQGVRVGWAAILAHAYSQVCCEFPELCDLYVSRPIPYMYRHPDPVATFAVHRVDERNRERLIWGRIVAPHQLEISALQAQIEGFSKEPIEQVYRDGLRLERQLKIVRRLQWHLLMRWCGRKRAKHLGTFSLSSLGHFGALNGYHPLVTTTSLAMGPLEADGKCDMVLLCDHRVIDGVLGSRALESLEKRVCQFANEEDKSFMDLDK